MLSFVDTQMEKLCIHYGALIGYLDSRPYHDMPTPCTLAQPRVEAHLRKLGFGYRARYLYETALLITQHKPPGWLDGLRNPEAPILGGRSSDAGEMSPQGGREGYRRAHEELLALQGVGPKFADCVCLMGLGWGEAVPVDTHVWQIAQRDYRFGKGRHSSLTKATYDAVGDKFRSLWGKEAGWAHSVLFTADLRAFSERLAAKFEVTEVKKEDEEEEDVNKGIRVETKVTAEILTPSSVKREFIEDSVAIKQEELKIGRTAKRRRKA